ncbi:hypothetical protein [Dysgonomonas sp. GY617]|uniref:hypothetical protein n=1 Tax=Dysgonomonas sp. GY617 TaxID=2780420 RepID=UPI0018841298|nr:hypothetical protein [Dysgonomonas sp. GY617]MBF0577473.1 hypothetical protein [Dysgonomonas sp. GY617]
MKAKKYILGLLGMALFFTACDPDVGDKPGIGNAPSVDDIKFTMTPSAQDANTIQFDFTSDLISPYWAIKKLDGSVMSTNKRSFSMKYMWAGEYDGSIQAFGRGGLSEPKAFKVSVPNNDPIIYILTGKDTPKVWIWDSSVAGHLGCGEPSTTTPNWWSAGPNELKGRGIYDDELTFILNSTRDYSLKTNNDIYVNEAAAKTMAPDLFPNGSDVAVTVPYTQPKGQTWFMDRDADGKLYLTFSNKGFPSYVAHPDVLGNVRYEILELTENTLQLQWKGSGINWYMRFKVKQ